MAVFGMTEVVRIETDSFINTPQRDDTLTRAVSLGEKQVTMTLKKSSVYEGCHDISLETNEHDVLMLILLDIHNTLGRCLVFAGYTKVGW